MGLFSRKKNVPKNDVFFEQEFTQAESFRGFKRAKLSTYGYKPIEKSLAKLKPYDFTGRSITLRGIKYDGGRCLLVLVDGNHIGTMFGKTYEDVYKAILKGKATAAYVMVNDDEKVFLFVKLGD